MRSLETDVGDADEFQEGPGEKIKVYDVADAGRAAQYFGAMMLQPPLHIRRQRREREAPKMAG